jgi:hypothetical protein
MEIGSISDTPIAEIVTAPEYDPLLKPDWFTPTLTVLPLACVCSQEASSLTCQSKEEQSCATYSVAAGGRFPPRIARKANAAGVTRSTGWLVAASEMLENWLPLV